MTTSNAKPSEAVGFIDDENRSDKYRKMPKRNRVRIKKKVGD